MIKNHEIYTPLYTDKEKFIILITGGRGCEAPETPIMMADLTIKELKDIREGDHVMGDDGTPRRVLSTAKGCGQLYKVHQKNAEDYIVNDTHILTLKKRASCLINDIPIQEFLAKSNRFRQSFCGVKSKSIAYPRQSVKIPPYILGVWLGNGLRITTPDDEVVLKAYNLIGNKHIPQEYISNSEAVRLSLLAGLLDTDGTYAGESYEITQKSKALARQIKLIADTLGFRTHISTKYADGKPCYRLFISGDIWRIPCRVKRKKAPKMKWHKDWNVSLLDITPIGVGNWCGIMVDGNHRYLHADGTITHNSGKSYAASAFIERLTFEKTPEAVIHQILYTRYTMVSAGISVIPEVMEKIEADGTERFFHSTRTDIVNRLTGSRIMFRGIKTSSGVQTAKLKSIHGITTFVCDEAEEWTSEKEFNTIMLSIRQQGIQNRIIIIMNPTDSNHFIYQKYIRDTYEERIIDGVPVQISTHPNVLHIHTTYLDNIKNLSDQFVEEVERMKRTDPEKYAHIVMGRWTDVAEGAVFKKWGIVEAFPANARKVAVGLDFGYTADPSACVRCGIVDNDLYLDEVFYKRGMLINELITELRKTELFVYADSADPRLIDEIALGGVIIYPVQKGAGSIIAGIEKIKTFDNIYVTKHSYNIQNELRNYVWAKDKFGNYINQPEDHDNHLCDSFRYYINGHILGKVLKPKKINPDQLGIY